MTEQEAEAVRLERIWGLNDWQVHMDGTLSAVVDVQEKSTLTINDHDIVLGKVNEMKRGVGYLRCEKSSGRITLPAALPRERLPQSFNDFADQWLPFFRRGCWLSGCDIEASAHEKAEWMQGFSQEELEAWNLKI